MRKTLISILCLVACAFHSMTYATDFASKVNTLIGTDYTGNTYPGAQVPFGMVQLSPDNGLPGWDRIAGYFYPDSTIAGFSHTHLLGTGAGDLYDISFLPVTLPYNEAEEPLGIHSRFTHKDETAHAGYYQVRLTDYDINVELTATPRCGVQRYTFPNDGKERMVILDLNKAMNWDATVDSKINVVDSFTIEGYRYSDGWARNQRVWFRTRFSQPIKSLEIENKKLQNNPNGVGCIARFKFATEGFDKLVVTTALSPTSLEGAQKNLQAEAKTDDFDAVRRQAETLWNNELGRIEIEGASKSQETVFYTSLYHAMSATYVALRRRRHLSWCRPQVAQSRWLEQLRDMLVVGYLPRCTSSLRHPHASKSRRDGQFAHCVQQGERTPADMEHVVVGDRYDDWLPCSLCHC